MKLFPSFAAAGAAVVLTLSPTQSVCAQIPDAAPFAPPDQEAAEEGDPFEGPVTISIMEEVFSLSPVEADNLLHDIPSDRLRYARLREMLAAGKARLEKLMVLRTKSGQRAVVESVHELRFIASVPVPPPAPLPPAENADKAPEVAVEGKPLVPPPAVSTPAITYETRNIGDTLELEPVLGPDGMTIDLNLVPQTARYLGERTLGGNDSVKQPIIEVGKVTTSLSVRDGHPVLLGTVHPPLANGFPGQQKEQRVWLEFLTVNLIRAEAPEPLPKGAAATLARAQKMRIPKLEFRDTSILDAVEFLQKRSVEIDPAPAVAPGINPAPLVPRGIRFILKAPPNLLQTKVTLSLKDVSLLDAAREVAKRAAFILEPGESALLLRAAGESP